MTGAPILTGKDFRGFMIAMGWTREKAAVALGLSVSQVDNLAHDRHPIRRMHALAMMAHVSLKNRSLEDSKITAAIRQLHKGNKP